VLLVKPFFQFWLASAQVTYFCFKLLVDYSHVTARLALHGMYLSYELGSYFAHVRLYFCDPCPAFNYFIFSIITWLLSSYFLIPLPDTKCNIQALVLTNNGVY